MANVPGHKRIVSGTALRGPYTRKHYLGSQRREVEGFLFRQNYRTEYHWLADFDGTASATLSTMGVSSVITKTAGTPTVAQVSNTLNGEVAGTLDSTNELQRAGISFGDQLMWGKPDVATPVYGDGPFFEARVKTAAIGANQGLIIGVATAYNSTLASITKYAWFRLNGNMNLTIESNDGTTANLAVAPTAGTITLTAATYYYFTIDFSDPTNVLFWFDDGKNDLPVGGLAMGALAATDVFQPLILVTKESGTGTPAVTIDAVSWKAPRY